MVSDFTAQTYLVLQHSPIFHQAHLFIVINEGLELVDSLRVPGFVDEAIFLESVRKRWTKAHLSELVISNRKVFNLEAIRDMFPQNKVLAIDVGIEETAVVLFDEGMFKIKEERLPLVHAFYDNTSVKEFFEQETTRVFDYYAEKLMYPARMPATLSERFIEQLAVQQVLKDFVTLHAGLFTPKKDYSAGKSSAVNIAVLTGEVFTAHVDEYKLHPAIADMLFTFLNSTATEGVWRVYLDTNQILSSLGRLKKASVRARYDLKSFTSLLGTVIILNHNEKDGAELGSLHFDLGYSEPQEVSVVAGEIVRLPFNGKVQGNLSLSLHNGVTIIGAEDVRHGLEIIGGRVGIVIDARQRPIVNSKSHVANWYENFGLDVSELLT